MILNDPKSWDFTTKEWIKKMQAKLKKIKEKSNWPPLIYSNEFTGRIQNNTQELYNDIYKTTGDADARRIRYFWDYDEVRHKIVDSHTFVDVGGGPGRNLYLLYLLLCKSYILSELNQDDYYFEVVDFSQKAEERFHKQNRNTWATFTLSKLEDYKSNVYKGFDVVMCFETLEHITSLKEGVMKLWEITSDYGIILISVPHGYMKDGKTHMWRTEHDGMFHLLEECWKVPITFYPWAWSWSHIYLSAIKQNIRTDPIKDWNTPIGWNELEKSLPSK